MWDGLIATMKGCLEGSEKERCRVEIADQWMRLMRGIEERDAKEGSTSMIGIDKSDE